MKTIQQIYLVVVIGFTSSPAALALPQSCIDMHVHSMYGRGSIIERNGVEVLILATFLRYGSNETKLEAARLIGHLGEKSVAAIPELIEAMPYAQPELRSVILSALDEIGGRPLVEIALSLQLISTTSVKNLLIATRDYMSHSKSSAGYVMGRLACSSVHPIRQSAGIVVSKLGQQLDTAVPTLSLCIDNSEGERLAVAIYLLSRMRASAFAELPKLKRYLEADDNLVVRATAWAIADIDPDSPEAVIVIPYLREELERRPIAADETTLHAIGTLRRIGSRATDAVPTLEALLGLDDPQIRRAALFALKAIDGREPVGAESFDF
jgi:HEAT repeat protein